MKLSKQQLVDLSGNSGLLVYFEMFYKRRTSEESYVSEDVSLSVF